MYNISYRYICTSIYKIYTCVSEKYSHDVNAHDELCIIIYKTNDKVDMNIIGYH